MEPASSACSAELLRSRGTRRYLEPLVNNLSVPQHRSSEKESVDAVEDASMAGQPGS
jgi:hypothetical protein